MVSRLFIFYLWILALPTGLAHCQEHTFQPGLILNFNGIQVEGDNIYFWEPSGGSIWGGGGISFGPQVSFDINKKFKSTLEIRYIRKGSIFEYINDYYQRDFEILNLKYIEIPFLIGYKLKTSGKPIAIETGIAYARLINAALLFNELTERPTKPDAENFKRDDISWVTQLKVGLDKNRKWHLGIRFSYSVQSIHKRYNLHNMVYGIEMNWLLFNQR